MVIKLQSTDSPHCTNALVMLHGFERWLSGTLGVFFCRISVASGGQVPG